MQNQNLIENQQNEISTLTKNIDNLKDAVGLKE